MDRLGQSLAQCSDDTDVIDPSEAIVVTAMLRDPGRHGPRLAGLDPGWFGDQVTRTWFKALRARPMGFHSAETFAGTIRNEALRGTMLVGLSMLLDVEAVQDADIDFAAHIIADRAKRHHMLDRLRWSLEAIDAGKLHEAECVIGKLAVEVRSFGTTTSPEGIADLADATLRRYEAAADSGGAYMPTGFTAVDSVLDGGMPGELWMVGGYAGDGKTMLTLNMAYHRWLSGGTVVWVPREMSTEAIAGLFLIRHSATMFPESPLRTKEMRRGRLEGTARATLGATVRDIRTREAKGRRWHVWKPGRATTMDDIAKYLEGQRHKMSVDMLVVDYLEQLNAVKDRRSSREELNDTLGQAKSFAESYNGGRGLWLVSPHQVSRDGKKECEKRKPTPHYLMSDLAESSRAERDADVVMWVLRTAKMKAIHQVLVGAAKARGSETVEYGVKLFEDYGSAYLGNLAGDHATPSDGDFDDVT